jgi:electron transfer flavoprotein alpha subunit
MKNVLAYLDSINGNIKRTAFEVATAAKMINGNVFALSINGNDSVASQIKDYGIENLINVNSDLLKQYSSSAVAEIIFQVAKNKEIDTLVFPANSYGLELAARLSAKMQAGYISDVIEINVNGEDLIVKKPVYAGKSIITAKINTPVKIISIRPNVFTPVKNSVNLHTEEFTPNLSESNLKAVVVDTYKNEGKLDVKEADIIVSGGRGIKGPEYYNLIEDLANVLGAAVGASRAVVDAGWRPHSEQVGQTGKTVSPTLYIACGISGAIQHLAGMSSSKFILAINKDKDAPIFKVADYGIVGDLFNVLPKLTQEIQSIVK